MLLDPDGDTPKDPQEQEHEGQLRPKKREREFDDQDLHGSPKKGKHLEKDYVPTTNLTKPLQARPVEQERYDQAGGDKGKQREKLKGPAKDRHQRRERHEHREDHGDREYRKRRKHRENSSESDVRPAAGHRKQHHDRHDARRAEDRNKYSVDKWAKKYLD